MLKKDRNEPKLNVLACSEALATMTAAIVVDEKKIPKRKQNLIGKRMLDHALNCFENVRMANSIYPDKSKDEPDLYKREVAYRQKLQFLAEKEAMNLASDIKILPTIVKEEPDTKWITMISEQAVRTTNIISKWRDSDIKRYKKST